MNNFLKYKTSSPAGDLISFLAGIKKVWEDTGRQAIVYQRLNMPGVATPTSIHPFKNDEGEEVCMNEYMFDKLRPLLLSQDYIADFLQYKGEEVDIDFDKIRMENYTNQPKGSLNRWFNYVYPQMASDLSRPWLEVPQTIKYAMPTHNKVMINFTQRYRNYLTNYYFLKNYQDSIVFVGLRKERDLFCSMFDLEIELLEVDNFYELAQYMYNSKFFLGNQSFCFQLAEGLKVPRILETSPALPNVIPIGENAYDFYHQTALEYYFGKLYNR